jgi:hypothetical protein
MKTIKSINKSKTYWILALPCCIFLIWYFAINYYNTFSLDDYWHGAHVQKYGFIGAQKYYYLNWEGSFSHTIFATLPHLTFIKTIFGQSTWIYISISFISIVFSITYAIRKFNLVTNSNNAIILSIYFISILYIFTSGKQEILYWTSANFTYITGIAFLILSFTFLFNFKQNFKFLALFPIIFLLGNKVNYGILFFLGFAMIYINNESFKSDRKNTNIIIFISVLIYSLNILAKGNYLRLEQNITGISDKYTLLKIIEFRTLEVILPFMLKSAIFIFPIVCLLNKEILKYLPLKKALLLFVVYFFIECIIYWLSFRDPGPARGSIVIEFFCLLILISIAYHFNIASKRYSTVLSYFSIFLISALQAMNWNYISIAKDYNKKVFERICIVESAKSNIYISNLPESGLLHSVWCNDETWLNYVFIPYFNKTITIKITNNDIKN